MDAPRYYCEKYYLSSRMYHGIKLLVIFLFICISVNGALPDYDEQVCIGQGDGTLLGITGYCTYYYYCEGEIGYLEDCKSFGDFQFDESIKNCNYPAEVNCVEEPEYLDYPDLNVIPDAVCPTNRPGEILLFESLKCSEYYICANGVKLTMKCIKGLVFNTKNNQCDHPIYNPRCSVSKYFKNHF